MEENMEEKRLVNRFNDAFAITVPILDNIKKGFLTHKLDVMRENKAKFREMVKTKAVSLLKIIEEPNKSEADKEYLLLIPAFQTIGLALENLMNKMETKVELKILFSEKALTEIKEIYSMLEEQFRDTRDYIATKNPVLKANIKASYEKVFNTADGYALIHQERLIKGICMPEASYLYLDIIDSIKRISRGLIDFADKV